MTNDLFHITWTPPKDDLQNWIKLNLVVLNVEGEADIRHSIAHTSKGEYMLQSDLFSRIGNGLHIYIGFQDSYTNELSDSVYLGKLV